MSELRDEGALIKAESHKCFLRSILEPPEKSFYFENPSLYWAEKFIQP